MLQFIARRIAIMVPILLGISLVVFIIIQLPPGDFLEAWRAQLESSGVFVDEEMIQAMRDKYGFGESPVVHYFKWLFRVLQGDFGYSFHYKEPVVSLIGERLLLTLALTTGTLVFTWIVAFPIGVYSAIRQYSLGDYIATFIGFIGLAVPGFLLALLLMYFAYKYLGFTVGGLFSSQFESAPWSWAKFVDMMKHLWIPVIVVGMSDTAGLIRILRANLLDELPKAYVTTARSGGLPEWKVLTRYPVRMALNPFVSTVGHLLPQLISGATITSVVLSLPTAGPMLLDSLQSQDMYLAGTFVMLLAVIGVVGTLISDILLALLDPRIRYQ